MESNMWKRLTTVVFTRTANNTFMLSPSEKGESLHDKSYQTPNWMIRGLDNDTAIVLAQAGIPGLDFTGTKYEKYMPDHCKTKRKG